MVLLSVQIINLALYVHMHNRFSGLFLSTELHEDLSLETISYLMIERSLWYGIFCWAPCNHATMEQSYLWSKVHGVNRKFKRVNCSGSGTQELVLQWNILLQAMLSRFRSGSCLSIPIHTNVVWLTLVWRSGDPYQPKGRKRVWGH